MKLIDLTRINQLIDGLLDKINDKYATKAELGSGLKGKAEVNHGTHLTLGNTQNNAYRGDYGNAAYNHSLAAHAPSNAQKNSDITKAEIEAKLTGTITSHTHNYAAASHTHNYAAASHTHDSITNQDTRSVNTKPSEMPLGLSIHLKSNGIDGLNDGGNYHSSLMIKVWNDISGGPFGQLSITQNSNLYFRSSADADNWNAWKKVSLDGHTHNYAGSSSAGGAANTAVKLHTARTINGTSFNGSGNITTANWGTARNITIGSTTKSVNGSENVSWSLSEIGAATASSVGTLSSLKTSAKGNLVAAINELFQSANNGKQLIANAIGNSDITSNSTFSAMSDAIIDTRNAITDTRNRLYNLMVKGGYDVNSNMNMDSLLNLLELSGISVGDIKQIACGYNYTFILKHDGSLWGCGYNISGQLGLGNNTRKTLFTQVTTNINNDVKQVACGSSHTVILKKDGSIWACGGNGNGQLGLGSKTDKNTFTKVTTNINNDLKQLACGEYHTFIFKNDGSAWCCGLNNYGQLGLNDTTTKNTFTQVTTNVSNDVEQISCGYSHTFILKKDGTIWSCGYNGSGQLGLVDTANKSTFTQVTTNVNNDVKQIACGQNNTFILNNDGSLWGCGYNNYGQLGLGTTNINYNTFTQVTTNINNDVKQIACGSSHTVILKNDGSIWSCGGNGNGQLGISGAGDKKTFTQVITNINNDVKLIACGGSHTFILKTNDSVWACGYNYHGQLGLDNNYETGGFTSYTNFTDILRGL